MAITTHRAVTGIIGGALGLLNVGSGADVTWSGAVTTYPTLANSGLYYTTAEGTGTINLAASNAARGTYYAWNTQGDDPAPVWCPSPGYWELPTGVSGQFVEFLTAAMSSALTSAQQRDGLEVTFGLGLAIGGAYANGTNPANNAAQVINQTIDTGGSVADTNYQLRILTRNVTEFNPGWGVDISSLAVGTETISFPVGGGGSTNPQMMMAMGDMAKIRVHWQRATSESATDGTVMVFVNDVLMHKSVSASLYCTTQAFLFRYFGLGSGYTAITGVKIRYCGPVMVRTVPVGDLDADLSPPWSINTTRSHDLRRWYAAKFANVGGGSPSYGAPWALTGTATLPDTGTAYASSGVNPGRSRFVIPGTAAQTFNLVTTKAIWSGSAGDSPLENGWCWLKFSDLYHANNCDITLDVCGIHTIVLKASDNTFVVDGVTKATGLSTSKRYEVVVGVKAGQSVVQLHDCTTDDFGANTLRSYAVSNAWAGTSLPVLGISGLYAGSVSAEIGSVGVFSRYRIYLVDSYLDAAYTGLTPTYHGLGSRSAAFLGQGQDITVPGGYDPVPYGYTGFSGLSECVHFARSGNRRSQFLQYIAPQLADVPYMHGLCFCGDVNDITQATATDAAALANALTIVNAKVQMVDLFYNSGGTAIITDAPNVVTGSSSGSWTRTAMKVPSVIADLLPARLNAGGYGGNRVFYCEMQPFIHEEDDEMDPDGIHLGTNGAGREVILMHKAKTVNAAKYGANTDGSYSSAGGARGYGSVS